MIIIHYQPLIILFIHYDSIVVLILLRNTEVEILEDIII